MKKIRSGKWLASGTLAVLAAVGLTACGEGDHPTPETTTATSASATDEATTTSKHAPAPTTGKRETTETTAESTTQPETASDAAALDELEEVDALMFTGNGSGTLAGTRFTSPDESVHCHFAGEKNAYVVMSRMKPGNHGDWPDSERVNDGVDGQISANTIGWRPNAADFSGPPKTWALQGTWPAVNTGVPLKKGTKVSVRMTLESDDDVTCGAPTDDTITCSIGSHGFTVGEDTYRTW